MKKKMKKILTIVSSVFGVFAICGLSALSIFAKQKNSYETKAINEQVMSTILFYDEHVSVPYNKVVDGNRITTRNVDYHVSYNASLVRRVDLDNVQYYIRIMFSYMMMNTFVTLDTQQDASFRPSWSNQGIDQEYNQNVGYMITTDYLSSNTTFSFNFWLLNAGIYSDGSGALQTHYWNTFRLQDVGTGQIYGGSNTSFDMSGDCYVIPREAYLDPYNNPDNFRFNFDGQGTWLLFTTMSFDADTTSYEQGYEYGYNDGYKDGNGIGFQNGLDVGRQNAMQEMEYYLQQARDEGYQAGFQAGVTDVESQNQTALTIFNGILSVGMLPVNFFLSVFNFEILGINLSAFISALLTIAVTIIVVRLVVGGKNGQ